MEKLLAIIGDFLVKNGLINVGSSIIVGAIVGLFFILYLSQSDKKKYEDLKIATGKNFDELKKEILETKHELTIFNRSRDYYEYLKENESIFKNIIDLFNEESKGIYELVIEEVSYIEKGFKKNYINGSHKDKSIELIDYGNGFVLKNLSASTIEKSSKNIILLLWKFISGSLLDVAVELEKMTSASMKISLIAKHFENIRKLIRYTKIKHAELATLDDDTIKQKYSLFFYSLDINIKRMQEKEFEDVRREL